MTHLRSEKARLSGELEQALEQIIELKEQVDANLGSDQMVSQLTQKNFELEDKIEKLTEERNDLVSWRMAACDILNTDFINPTLFVRRKPCVT